MLVVVVRNSTEYYRVATYNVGTPYSVTLMHLHATARSTTTGSSHPDIIIQRNSRVFLGR